jgi:hypothetical protein
MATQFLFRVLMSVGLLFPGLPGWRHAHAAGDLPHDHFEHGHHASHKHQRVGESHVHVHFTLLSVNFTFPVESSDDASPHGRVTLLVAASIALDVVSPSQVVSLAQPALEGGEVLSVVPTFRCIAVLAAPLCDTARRERTGVLLI